MLYPNPINEATLLDFGGKLDRIPLLCDNESAVKLPKIRFNTLAQSTLIFAITSCVITKPKEIYLFKV